MLHLSELSSVAKPTTGFSFIGLAWAAAVGGLAGGVVVTGVGTVASGKGENTGKIWETFIFNRK